MSSIYVAKVLSSSHKFANRNWHYDFRKLPCLCDEDLCQKNAQGISQQYSKITKKWDTEKNSEWICRIYLSAKMVLNSTLQLMSLDHAHQQNLRSVSPYLKYYSVLSALRCLVFTLPAILWENGGIAEHTHTKTINIAFDYFAKFNKQSANALKKEVMLLKAQRELIAYRAPTSGDYGINEDLDIPTLCTIFVELAQFNSEILENSIHKHASNDAFVFNNKYIQELSTISVSGMSFHDKEDWYRLDYLRRKWPTPPNILHIMTEGHTKDFFGAWEPEEENEEVFSTGAPCEWQGIFDIP